MKIERLAGPAHNIGYTQDVPNFRKVDVSVVNEAELQKLEKFFELPIHQQISHVKGTISQYMRDNIQEYPKGIFLANSLLALDLAEKLTFSHFAAGLTVVEILDM